MRVAIIEEGKVANVIVAESATEWGGVEAPEDASIGWTYASGVFTRPQEPVKPVVMPSLSPRQIRLMILQIGMAEAAILGQIALIPDPGERAAAEIEWTWAPRYDRDHPLVISISSALGFTPTEFDVIWAYAAEL